MKDRKDPDALAASEGARRATGDAARASRAPERGRFTSKRKMEAVLRVLRGEDLDNVSREIGVTAGRLATWREDFLDGGQASLKSRRRDARDDEVDRLKRMVGELTMDNELLVERCRRQGVSRPLPRRRRKP